MSKLKRQPKDPNLKKLHKRLAAYFSLRYILNIKWDPSFGITCRDGRFLTDPCYCFKFCQKGITGGTPSVEKLSPWKKVTAKTITLVDPLGMDIQVKPIWDNKALLYKTRTYIKAYKQAFSTIVSLILPNDDQFILLYQSAPDEEGVYSLFFSRW